MKETNETTQHQFREHTNPKTVMIIDDNPDDVYIFCEIVSQANLSYSCLAAESAEEGLQFLEDATEMPNFIFLDLNMPGTKGQEFLLKIKTQPKFAGIPVIIYTSSWQKKDIDETKELGAAFFLTKPDKFDELIASVYSILQDGTYFNSPAA